MAFFNSSSPAYKQAASLNAKAYAPSAPSNGLASMFGSLFGGTTPVYKTMVGISRSLSKVVFKQILSNNSIQYNYNYININKFPKLNNNQVNTVDAALTFLGRTMSYDA